MLGTTKKEYEHQSAAFAGVRFSLFGFDPLGAHKVRAKLIEGGGIDAGQYAPNCTHVIVDKIVYDDPICLAARSDGKTLVTGLWVDHSYDIGLPVDPTAIMYRPLRDLNGIPGAKLLTVCLTGYQRQDRDDIMAMVGLMGAQFSKPLVASKVTHLVCYKFEGEKYELAKKITRIKLVNHRWLEDCLSAWEILPESHYAKSGHEMEMDAEAKDSDEDVTNDNNNEQNSKLKIGGSHTTYVGTLRTSPSPLPKQDISRTVTPIKIDASQQSKQEVSRTITHLSSLSKLDASRTITPPIRTTNQSPLSIQDASRAISPLIRTTNQSPLSMQDVSRAITPPIRTTNQSPLSMQDVPRAITPIRTNQSPLSKHDASRTVTPISANKGVTNVQTSNSTALATGEGSSNKTSPSHLYLSNEPLRAAALKINVNQDATFMSSIEREKRTLDFPSNSPKLQKTSQNLKEDIFEPPLQCRLGVGPDDDCHRSLLTNSSVSSASKAQFMRTLVGSNLEGTNFSRTPEPPPGNVSLLNEEFGNKSVSTSASGMFSDILNPEFLKCDDADSLLKSGKETLARKCLGSRPKYTPYRTENQKGSLHSSRDNKQSSTSVVEEGMSKKYSGEVETKLAAAEAIVTQINADHGDNANASLDDETEAPDMIEENVIAAVELKDKPWVEPAAVVELKDNRWDEPAAVVELTDNRWDEPAADPFMVANEEETLLQNEHRISKSKASKSRKRQVGKMSNNPVYSLPKTKKPKDDCHEKMEESEKKDEVTEPVMVKCPNALRKRPNIDNQDMMTEEGERNGESTKRVNVKRPNPSSSIASRKKPKGDSHGKMEGNEKDETIEEAQLECPDDFGKKSNDDSHGKMAESERMDGTTEKVNVKHVNASRKKGSYDNHDKVAMVKVKAKRLDTTSSNGSRMKPNDDTHDKMAESEKEDERIEEAMVEKVKERRPSASRKKPKNDIHDKIAESEKKDETKEEVKGKRARSNPSRKESKDNSSHDKMVQSEKKEETSEKLLVRRPNSSRKKPKDDIHNKMAETETNEAIEEAKVKRPRPNPSRKKPKDDSHEVMEQSKKRDETVEKVKAKRSNTGRQKENLTGVGKENRPSVENLHLHLHLQQQLGEVTPTPKLSETTPSVAAKGEATCFILAGHRLQRKEFRQVIRRLKGKVCRDSHQWSYQATHFIVPDPLRRTEKFFAAAASGRWILKTDYLTGSNEAGRFVDEKDYEWHNKGLSEDGAISLEAPRKWRLLRERTGHGAFYGMRVIIYGDCISPSLETLKRAIKAGDGVLLATAPPYDRFLKSGVDFAVVSPGTPRVDTWVQEFMGHEVACVAADYLVEYVCKPGYSLDKHVQYKSHAWAERSLKRLAVMSEEPSTPECGEEEEDLACQVCGCRDRGEEMLICGDESGSVGCGVGMHLDCCHPPLSSVPKDDWFCASCCNTVSLKKKKRKSGMGK